ncbi:hypothetical protein FA15DRAFT_687034 [Coprinopsis marcescibilis]|uniref:Trafficking protein particle complex II-specific subunit 65 IgD3 domain-containing protein n=1 Tax=Coprinopsis marcescibilis TaxID=230819 RepID=A0A5C3KY15_COPMA|nr:hypothetical protein FA15DRAFT_687034 [Coprinopsis marcescibilis]
MAGRQVFSSADLSVVIPDTSLEFPPQSSVDEWLGRVKIGKVERKQAFFDEQLQSLLLLRVQHPTPDVTPDPKSPPLILLEFLNYLQISLEANYLAPQVAPAQHFADTPRTSLLSAPPARMTLAKSAQLNLNSGRQPPSIIPPATPNPIPSTGDQDRQYAGADGPFLAALIWGNNTSENSKEAFSLVWSEKEKVWVALYRLVLTVSFVKAITFPNPLLSLTVSTTLRDKPIVTSERHPLAKFLATLGVNAPESPVTTSPGGGDDEREILLDGLEEINLLEGLLAGPVFAQKGAEEINLPSLRLGVVSRQKLFSLPPMIADTPTVPSPSPMTAVRKAHPTLRKSHRKTLPTVSSFELRMRTVFVPYVLLPQTEGAVSDLDEVEKERERREAGSAERTVVLCVEVKNFGEHQEMRSGIGFLIESVDIKIAGDGAKTTLIGWGEEGLSAQAAASTFPLKLGPLSQVNLLYAVTFLRSPDELDGFSFAKPDLKSKSELRRGVSITVNGHPYLPFTPSARAHLTEPDSVIYPTRPFSSVWSTILDLDANPAPVLDQLDPSDPLGGYPNTFPEPASPFPAYAIGSARTPATGVTSGFFAYTAEETPQSSAFPGQRKFPLTPGGYFQAKINRNINMTPTRGVGYLPAHLRDQSPMPSAGRTPGYTPTSSLMGAMHYLRSPTTYSAPQIHTLPPPTPMGGQQFSIDYDEQSMISGPAFDIPPTPAYPAFPQRSSLPPSPKSQGPIASQAQNNVGPSVEIRRDRPQSMMHGLPQTPVAHVAAAFGEQRLLNKLQNSSASGESVVVSVGLLPRADLDLVRRKGEVVLGPDKIYPLDTFTLDIFIFNQSTWTRRFEITCPERRRRRRGGAQTGIYGGGGEVARKLGYPGVLPMDKRVRIGPLRPSACQSVRMDFLAVSPGVHSIDTLTLTDIVSGFSMNLRAVLDIVVHDPND